MYFGKQTHQFLLRAHDAAVIVVPAHPHSILLVLLLQPLLQGKEEFPHCVRAHFWLSRHHLHRLFPWSGWSHLEHLPKLFPSPLGSIEVTLMKRLTRVPLHILPCRWNSWQLIHTLGLHPTCRQAHGTVELELVDIGSKISKDENRKWTINLP